MAPTYALRSGKERCQGREVRPCFDFFGTGRETGRASAERRGTSPAERGDILLPAVRQITVKSIISIIPLGFVGAVLGHYLFGMDLTILQTPGMEQDNSVLGSIESWAKRNITDPIYSMFN